MNEMSLSVRNIAKDTLLFEVRDVITQKPLFATIELFSIAAKEGFALQTDSLGIATIKKTQDLQMLKATALAYRSLTIDVSRLKGL